MEQLLQVGIIAQTHGIKGEVKIFPTTDDAMRYKKLKEVIVKRNHAEEVLVIQSVKFFKKFVIVKFKDIDDINEVLAYKGESLYVTRDQAVPCQEDEYFIADLLELRVIDEKEESLGILSDVIQTGANDVYVITLENGKECLIPAIKECILKINVNEGIMQVKLLEGLLES
ncbi:MAG: ribosome maturation factor RimM [Eubacteriales bacterium]